MTNPRPAPHRATSAPSTPLPAARQRTTRDRTTRARPVAAVAVGVAALTLAVLVLAACAPLSDGAAPSPGGTPSGPGTTASAEDQALLEVSIRADESAEPEEYVLECVDGAPGPTSTHPDPEAACANVLSLGAEFFTAERDTDLACTQQYGGPQTAHVVGTVGGEAVDTQFSRTDGCEIARWDAAQSLLGPGGVDLPPDSSGPRAARP